MSPGRPSANQVAAKDEPRRGHAVCTHPRYPALSAHKKGWTSVIGKRSWHKVPSHLLRLRAPPYIRASLPTSDSNASEPLTPTALCTFLLVLMFITHLTVENQASGLLLRVLPVAWLPFHQELGLILNDRVYRLVLAHGYFCAQYSHDDIISWPNNYLLCYSCRLLYLVLFVGQKFKHSYFVIEGTFNW